MGKTCIAVFRRHHDKPSARMAICYAASCHVSFDGTNIKRQRRVINGSRDKYFSPCRSVADRRRECADASSLKGVEHWGNAEVALNTASHHAADGGKRQWRLSSMLESIKKATCREIIGEQIISASCQSGAQRALAQYCSMK